MIIVSQLVYMNKRSMHVACSYALLMYSAYVCMFSGVGIYA